ncbi:hypothetical protein ACIBI8_36095 [Streptomyces sp. NPDC050529]|uniref:hypothetical protein n=1 Tax=Streptomyces sp. NPDC050529 TaxID=3365624 RepID=UPI0037A4695F
MGAQHAANGYNGIGVCGLGFMAGLGAGMVDECVQVLESVGSAVFLGDHLVEGTGGDLPGQDDQARVDLSPLPVARVGGAEKPARFEDLRDLGLVGVRVWRGPGPEHGTEAAPVATEVLKSAAGRSASALSSASRGVSVS